MGRPKVHTMTRRACMECSRIWTGTLSCPDCGAPGEPIPAPKRGPGRPKVGDARVSFALTVALHDALKARARADGVSVATWCRRALTEAATARRS